MLLTLTTTHAPATDLGYLLQKHPDRFQSFELAFGKAHVFYPQATAERCTACLLLEVDPVGMVRGMGKGREGLLDQYVNDRPYVASSLLSVAIAQVFGSAMNGRSKDRPELAATPIPLEARLDALPVRGGEDFLGDVFGPLGYEVESRRLPLDPTFPEWGESPYFAVTLRKTTTLAELLTHLYILIPVFDNAKHYWVGDDEIEKLIAKGEGWLAQHPRKDMIARRFLRHQSSLFRQAIDRLVNADEAVVDETEENDAIAEPETTVKLNDQRRGAVLAALKGSGARRILDLGCGDGKILRDLAKERQFTEIVGVDVAIRSLEIASERLRRQGMFERVKLLHGSLMYRDKRLAGFEAAAVVEVVEHLDPPRLRAFERTLFEFARPGTVVLTTPNRDYNAVWETLPAGKFRHPDHRFEWSRDEFAAWTDEIAKRYGYRATLIPIGPVHAEHGSPTQMAIFAVATP